MDSTLSDSIRHRRPAFDLRIVDAHAHLGPTALFFVPDNDDASMVAVMDRCGVARALISSHLAVQVDAARGNELTAQAVSRFPGRLSGYLVVNPWQAPDDELARWADDERFVGIKLHPDLHRCRLSHPRYRVVWEFAESVGCPVLTHTWYGSEFDGIDEARTVVDAHPGVTLIAGHSWVKREGFDDAVAVARDFPQIILELCGSFNHRRVIEQLVAEVGADRVAYGSDFPFIDCRPALGRLAFARLSTEDLRSVASGTIERATAWRGSLAR